ncbi:MAG: S8 family serine peptidase, partial [Herpetosiphonaceae bacterium]|nr:S8 family serine peptidase [Herpetosiphonaceae bacterium]
YNPSSVLTTTGIHPSLSDPSPVGGNYPSTFPYKGVCAPTSPQTQDGTFGPCNDKLIGAWWYNAGNIADPGEARSPMDQSGHGTHTATTAGGNGGVVSPYGTVSGVAPRARIIAYKVCWQRTAVSSTDGGCSTLDSVAAINQSVLDGAQVLNFSISGGNSPWIDSVEVAFRNATAAGIIVNASAGNAGTVGSVAHQSPWLITVAASTEAREFNGYMTNVSGPTPPTPLAGASLKPGTVTGVIKLAPLQAVAGEVATLPGLCQAPYPAGTFAPTDIVICRRGINARSLKYANVFAGGAGGGIIVNNLDNQGIVADYCTRVCLHLEKNTTASSAAGDALIAHVLANPGATGTINGGLKELGPGDKMAGFSSKGPATTPNILKPDVTLVGVDVNAGNTAFLWDNDFDDGQTFQVISGTSMSSPHSAGISALMRQLYPTWTPAEIKSAMMSTAKTSVVQPDGTTPANPFNMGSGRVDPIKLVDAGLTLNETNANFVAANPATGGDPRTLNLANAVNNACPQICTWTRTVKNRSGVATTWNGAGSLTDNFVVSVLPATFTLAPDAEQVITIRANVGGVPIDGAWRFGRVTLTEANNLAPAAHFPVGVIAAAGAIPVEAPEEVEIETHRNNGSKIVDGYSAGEVTELTIREYGLVKGDQTTQTLALDSANDSPFDDLTDGVFYTTFTVPAGAKRLLAQILATTAPDMDLYIARDLNSDGIPQANESLYESTSPTSDEQVDELNPVAGTYFAVVQNWEASANAPDPVTLITAVVPNTNAGNLEVTGPATVPAATPFAVEAMWNEPTMLAGEIWYGLFDVGTDAANPGNIGATRISVAKLADEVSKAVSSSEVAVGEYVTYTLTITGYATLADTFYLTDTLPAGLTIDQSSLTGGAVYNAGTNSVTWTGQAPASGHTITFRAMVTAAGAITNTVEATSANATGTASAKVVTTAIVVVVNELKLFLPIILK